MRDRAECETEPKSTQSPEPVLAAMIERAHAQRDTTSDDRRAELGATAHQITTTEAAISRYHTAFENGTMDDATAGPRIRELRQRLAQLQTRHAELEGDLAAPPAPPPPATITRIREHLTTIMASGTTSERKAAIETLIAEVQITDQGVVPVFKIPTDTTLPPPNSDGGTHDEQPPVRTMVRSVGRAGLEPATEGL
ncbi:hypothetical protein GCM10029963_63770 [Micromonospora andamanensis]|nr:hypothetical protein Vwe01_63250 [Micromonospora andamanensis]